MTRIEFMAFLESSLCFLDSAETKNALDFFEEKFSFCSSSDEEQAIIDAFGSSEKFLTEFKNEAKTSQTFNAKNYLEKTLRNHLNNGDLKRKDGDLIFSKSIELEKSSEVVHSLEDREVKTLYGEKVVIENREISLDDENVTEPMDEANGISSEEILLAKAKTLKKAEGFAEQEKEKSENKEPESRIPLEEDEHCDGEESKKEPLTVQKNFIGIFNRIFPSEKYNKKSKISLVCLLTVTASPLILLAFSMIFFIYAASIIAFAAAVVFLFLFMISIVAIGVVELVHGFLVFFDSVEAALIELGYGTVLFSLIIAVAALIYEFIFGIVPKCIKWLSKIFVHYSKLLYCLLYGGKA